MIQLNAVSFQNVAVGLSTVLAFIFGIAMIVYPIAILIMIIV